MDAVKYFCDCTTWQDGVVLEPNSGVLGQIRVTVWWLNFTALARMPLPTKGSL